MKSCIILIMMAFLLACNPSNKPVQAVKETVQENADINNISSYIKKDSIKNNNIKNDSIMNERYDYESTDGGKKSVYVEQNGWIIRKGMMDSGGADYAMYPPPPEFYEMGKQFYPNGNIKSEIKSLGGFVFIDTSFYYDEDGYLVKEVNENKKFGTVKPAFILKFLEREGWIDLKTGKGRTTFEFVEGYPNNPNYTECVFELQFELVGESYYIKDNKVPIWVVKIPVFPKEYRWEETTYLIDGETGKMLSKERKKVFKNR